MKRHDRNYGEENNINLKLIIALSRTHSDHGRRMQKLLSGYGLTIAQFGVLEVLYHLGDLKINDIIEKTLSTSGNITVVVKNLEAIGLIERYQDPKDKRIWMIHLTALGEAGVEKIFPQHLSHIQERFSTLDDDEKKQLIGLLKKLNGLSE